jgi:ATP-binding cassette subfamily C protein LapB
MDVPEIDPLVECLLVVSKLHHRSTSRDALVAGLPLPSNRLTPSLFHRAASRAGLASKLLRKPLDQFNPALLPAVLLLENEQACVLYRLDNTTGIAEVFFPELPEASVELPLSELNQRYLGVMLLARPRHRPEQAKAKPLDEDNWFWSAMRANLPVYRDVLVAALLINVFALAMPIFTMNVYDRVVPNHAVETLWMLAIGVGLVLLADMALRTLRGYFLDLASRRVDIRLSAQIMEKVLGIRLSARPLSVGAYAANLRSFETVRDFITSATVTAIIDVPFSGIFLLVIAWVAWPMIIPVLIAVIVIILVSWRIQKRLHDLTESTFVASAERNATLIESLVGLDTLKAMGAESMMQRRWEKSAAYLARTSVKLRLVSMSNVHAGLWVQQLCSVSVIVLGVYLITAGELTMGGLIACSMLTGRVMAPLMQVSGLMTQYHNAKRSLDALNDIMAQPEERPQGTKFVSRQHIKGDIEFQGVSFTYPGQQAPILKNVSFKIAAGEKVAMLGRVGSGKSTVEKLIMGLYQPDQGAVLIDGIDLRQLDPAEIRQQIGYGPQDVTLFQGSLRENLVLAHPHADDEAVLRAADLGCLTDFVNTHPKGFDMEVGERGDCLSGGQRKCIGLARAVIHDPNILLLDEPTGSMDNSTEAWVREKLAQYSEGRTMLVSTHRTSLLEIVDRIIVIDNGKVVADGAKDTVVDALRRGRIGRASV